MECQLPEGVWPMPRRRQPASAASSGPWSGPPAARRIGRSLCRWPPWKAAARAGLWPRPADGSSMLPRPRYGRRSHRSSARFQRRAADAKSRVNRRTTAMGCRIVSPFWAGATWMVVSSAAYQLNGPATDSCRAKTRAISRRCSGVTRLAPPAREFGSASADRRSALAAADTAAQEKPAGHQNPAQQYGRRQAHQPARRDAMPARRQAATAGRRSLRGLLLPPRTQHLPQLKHGASAGGRLRSSARRSVRRARRPGLDSPDPRAIRRRPIATTGFLLLPKGSWRFLRRR